ERDRGVRDDAGEVLALVGIEVEAADVVAVDHDAADGAVEEERCGERQLLVREKIADQRAFLSAEREEAARASDPFGKLRVRAEPDVVPVGPLIARAE